MRALPASLWLWLAAAVLLFWWVGAYNRLVRLRASVLQAFAAFDAALLRQIEFVQAAGPPAESEASLDEPLNAALKGAARQLTTLLAATRAQPIDPGGLAALETALHVLLSVWQRLHPGAVTCFDADGTLSRPAPLDPADRASAAGSASAAPPLPWPEPSAAAEMARGEFNLAVARYNAAVQQFPARLVAWLLRLRVAAPVR